MRQVIKHKDAQATACHLMGRHKTQLYCALNYSSCIASLCIFFLALEADKKARKYLRNTTVPDKEARKERHTIVRKSISLNYLSVNPLIARVDEGTEF